MNSIRTADGTKIPVLFRPWHEHTGSWFWWGQKLCSTEEYKALWSITYNRMKEKGADQLLWAYSPGTEPNDTTQYLERYPGDSIVEKGADQLLWAYSPGTEPNDTTQYLERYPGDSIVDLIGVDAYQYDAEGYKESLDRSLRIMTEIGKAHDKAIAVTETGFETIPDSTWWTQTLMPVIRKYPISYQLRTGMAQRPRTREPFLRPLSGTSVGERLRDVLQRPENPLRRRYEKMIN